MRVVCGPRVLPGRRAVAAVGGGGGIDVSSAVVSGVADGAVDVAAGCALVFAGRAGGGGGGRGCGGRAALELYSLDVGVEPPYSRILMRSACGGSGAPSHAFARSCSSVGRREISGCSIAKRSCWAAFEMDGMRRMAGEWGSSSVC